MGLKHRDAKPLKGLGAGANVLEIVSRGAGDTYRTVYTVQFRSAVCVLHAFQKKSKRGIETPKQEIDRVKHRLKVAQHHYTNAYGRGHRPMKTDETMVERGSGNVFADLGFPDSDTHLLKSELVHPN